MDDPWAVIGLIAGTLTTAGYIPQIVKGYRTKKLDDVSYLLLLLLGTGMTLWLVYGLLLVSLPLIISNTIATGLVVLLILMKHRYARRPRNAGHQQGNQ